MTPTSDLADAGLPAAYERCRQLHQRHGRTYYLATRLLPAAKRRHVHALYGFTRYADEIVDEFDGAPASERARRLREWGERFQAGLAGGAVNDPILPAVLHTIERYRLDRADFAKFLRSMAMDLDTVSYRDYSDLLDYMEGSAAVIGTMMLPILEPADEAAAREPARQLGFAFQLTNFIRDVAEDLERGRIYLPLADLERFGLGPDDLRQAALAGRSDARVKALIRFEIERAGEHYALAAPGIPMLGWSSQSCIRAAFHIYAAILDEVRRQDYDVFARRAVVPNRRRLRMAARCLLTPPGRPVLLPSYLAAPAVSDSCPRRDPRP
jgi:15-cis-phytoene synthase